MKCEDIVRWRGNIDFKFPGYEIFFFHVYAFINWFDFKLHFKLCNTRQNNTILNNIQTVTHSQHIFHLLDYKSTKLLGSAPDYIINFITQQDINYNNHFRGIMPEVNKLS